MSLALSETPKTGFVAMRPYSCHRVGSLLSAAVLGVLSVLAVILLGKKELIHLFDSGSCCFVAVVLYISIFSRRDLSLVGLWS